MPAITRWLTLVALCALGSAGCTAIISGGTGGGSESEPGETPAQEPAASESCSSPQLIPARVRKVTDAQYARLVRDVLPHVTPAVVATPGTELALIQDLETFVVRGPLASQYWDAAFAAAAQAVGDLVALTTCAPTPADPIAQRDCAEQFIASFGQKAFRRPLLPEDIAPLLQVFDAGAETSFEKGLELVVAAALQSADFLYRTELGGPDQVGPEVALTPYEVASLLSFMFLGGGPDAELYAAAQSGALQGEQGIAEQVARLLALPAVQEHVTALFLDVLGADDALTSERDTAAFPELDLPLRQAMATEVQHFVQSNVFGQRSLAELFTSREAVVTEQLARFYGVDYSGPPAIGLLPADQRTGILSRGATLLSMPTGSRAVHRGLYIANTYLCRVLAPPPAGVQAEITQTLALGLNERELSELRASKSTCAGCHANFDSLGLAFEHYDFIGKYLTERDGAPVDASGTLNNSDVDGPFANLIELSDLLAGSRDVAFCLPQRVTAQALGLTLDDGAKCSIEQLVAPWAEGEKKLGELVPLLSQSRFFLQRTKVN